MEATKYDIIKSEIKEEKATAKTPAKRSKIDTDHEKAAREINSLHLATSEAAKFIRDRAKEGLKNALLCGKMLREIKDLLPHGQWELWSKRNLDFSLHTAARYMKLANLAPMLDLTKLNSLKEAYITIGALPEPEQVEAKAGASKDANATAFNRIVKVASYVERIALWPEDRKQELRNQLKPLIDLLYGQQDAKDKVIELPDANEFEAA